LATVLARALRRRCPACGIGKPFAGWFRMTARCPHCRHHYEREAGYWVGALIMNTAVTEAIFGVVFIGVAVVSWPNVPWVPLLIVGAVINVAVPVFFYPLSKTTWVAVDIYFSGHPEAHNERSSKR
jgi:uncharacterized protein (DUF983 family)